MPQAEARELLQERLSALLLKREPPKTICPSEVPRSLDSRELEQLGAKEWRDLMPRVRELLWEMRGQGTVDILQKGEPVDEHATPDDIEGPIRARRTEKLCQ